MPAELDTIRTGEHAGKGRMVFGGELPWHRDGVKLTPEEQRRFDRVVELIDVPLEKPPYYVPAPTADIDGRPNYTAATDAFYVYRPDTRAVLGSVGTDYEPVSNRDAFAVLRPLVDDGTALIETAGVLRDGADAWMLVRWDTDNRYHFPKDTAAGIELTAAQFAMILDGIDVSRVRRFKRYSPPAPTTSRYPSA